MFAPERGARFLRNVSVRDQYPMPSRKPTYVCTERNYRLRGYLAAHKHEPTAKQNEPNHPVMLDKTHVEKVLDFFGGLCWKCVLRRKCDNL